MLSLHRGQGLELFWRDSLTCPTEEEYVKMVLGSAFPPSLQRLGRARGLTAGWLLAETGGLFRIAIKLMMAKSNCDMWVSRRQPSTGRRESGADRPSSRCSDFVPLVNLISIFFQIRDDYMNMQSSEVCPAARRLVPLARACD